MTHYHMSATIMQEMQKIKDNPKELEDLELDMQSVLFGMYLAWQQLSVEFGDNAAGPRQCFAKMIHSLIQA